VAQDLRKSVEERQCRSEACTKGCDVRKIESRPLKRKQPKYIQKKHERENKGPNEFLKKNDKNRPMDKSLYQSNTDSENLMKKEESFEKHTETSNDIQKQNSVGSEMAKEIHKKFLNTEILRSRESNFFSFGRSFEKKTADSDKDTRLRIINAENKFVF